MGLVSVLVVAACGGDEGSASPDVDAPDTAADVATDAVDDTLEDDTRPADPDAHADGEGDDVAADVVDEEDDTDVDVGPDALDPGPDPPLISVDAAMAAIDPFTGTGGQGFAYAALTPAPQQPLGFVRFGPDTTTAGFHPTLTHFSGYNFDTPDVRGFSHTHFVGTGAPDYGNLRMLPVRAWNEAAPQTTFTARDRASERATPGFYEVRLPDEALTARMSSGYFAAILEVVPDGTEPLALVFDAASSVTDAGVQNVNVTWNGDTIDAIVDYRGGFTGRTRGFTLYLAVTLEPAPDRWVAWGDEVEPNASRGASGGVVAVWDEPPAQLVMRSGLSLADLDGARANRAAEVDGRSVDEVAAEVASAWRDIVGRVRIAALDDAQADQFYSALYNAYRMPSRWSEPDGRYLSFDGTTHVAEDFTYYTDMSIWDTFRTLHPWYELTQPELTHDLVTSLLDMAAKGDGRVPRWPAAASYTGSMIGSCGEIVLAGAAAKEIGTTDWEAAFDVAFASSFAPLDDPDRRGREGVRDYVDVGWLPSDVHDEAPSKTLEYAWTDDVLMRWALRHDRAEQAAFLDEQAKSFERIFNPATRFFAPRRADGTFDGAGQERTVFMRSGPFTEGNAWHWRFYALQRASRLAELFGGEEELAAAIEDFFVLSNLRRPGPVRETVPPLYYWHGNEPAIHAAPMLALIGARDRAIHWSREIAYRLYGTGPAGLPGNDDGGTLSAWWLFTALGLYPIAGTDEYIWTYPLVPSAEVVTGPSTTLRIAAPGARRAAPQGEVRLLVDGEAWTAPTVPHRVLVNAELTFVVDATP